VRYSAVTVYSSGLPAIVTVCRVVLASGVFSALASFSLAKAAAAIRVSVKSAVRNIPLL